MNRVQQTARWLLGAAINPPLDYPSLRLAQNLQRWKQRTNLHHFPQKLASLRDSDSSSRHLREDQQEAIALLTRSLMQMDPSQPVGLAVGTAEGNLLLPAESVEVVLTTSLASWIRNRAGPHQVQ